MNEIHPNRRALQQTLSTRAKARRRRALLEDLLIGLLMFLILASHMWLGPLLRVFGVDIDS